MTIDAKTAPEEFVYDMTVPRRPTEDDMDPYTQDVAPVPLPGQLYAAQMNQRGMCVAALARVSPVAIITLDFASGAPFVDRQSSCSKVLEVGDLVVTDNGAGDTTIEWPENTFPTHIADPEASVCTDGAWLQPVPVLVTNGVRVKTRASGGTLTDVRVQVRIF
jgi:hypothetical protein